MNRAASILASTALAGAAVTVVATPAHAVDVNVTSGHVDVVEVACTDGTYEVASHVGATHVDPDDIGDYPFVIDASDGLGAGVVSYDAVADTYTVESGEDAEDVIPSVGFVYEVEGSGCAASVLIEWSTLSGPGEVLFEGDDSIVLSQNQHVHGTWTYTGATSPSATYTYEVAFESRGTTIEPATFRLQP